MSQDRERAVSEAFVALANSLVDGVDVVELLSELTDDCARLLDVASAGLLLADPRGLLHVAAASSQATRELECHREGTPVSIPDLSRETQRWPQFVPAALEAGFASVHAMPMRLQDRVLGTLGLFGTNVGSLNDDDIALAQALAHVASVSIVAGTATADKDLITQQLQTALTSRVVLEQARGLIAQSGGLDMDQAFARLRAYARDHNQRLTDVAHAVVSRRLPAQQILDHARPAGRAAHPRGSTEDASTT